MTTARDASFAVCDYLNEETNSLPEKLAIVGNALIALGLTSMGVTKAEVQDFNEDRLGFLSRYKKEHGETLAHATVAQGLHILVWLDKEKD